MTDNKHLPAYPNAFGDDGQGLTKREFMAAMCLQGFLSNSACVNKESTTYGFWENIASDATTAADALLTHLENTSK